MYRMYIFRYLVQRVGKILAVVSFVLLYVFSTVLPTACATSCIFLYRCVHVAVVATTEHIRREIDEKSLSIQTKKMLYFR